MSSSEIVTIVRRFRTALLQERKEATRILLDAYKEIWAETRAGVLAITQLIEEAREAGLEVDQAWLFQQSRFRALLDQVDAEMAGLAAATGEQLEQVQGIAVDLAQRGVNATLAAGEVGASFAQLPVSQITQLVGALADGSPLNRLLAGLGPQAGDGLRSALIKGVALGWNPRRIERAARETQGKVLSRILRIARTEAIRPYREATRLAYQNNAHLLDGWYWLSAANSRTCASCWAMHGTFHRLNERLDDHPNGRCVMVPAVKGVAFNIPTGTDLFKSLSPEEQAEVLSPQKLKAYQEGRVELSDFVARRRSTAWGSSRHEASLKEALGA